MQKLRPYVLPAVVILGLLFHEQCSMFAPILPGIIFLILLITFCTVDIKTLRPTMLDVWLMLFQIVVSTGCYVLLILVHANTILAESILVGVLCPVASSTAVISCMLGANRNIVTTYTIIGNLMVAVVAPLAFAAIGVHPELGFGRSFLIILRRIAPSLALPFFIAWLLQRLWPAANTAIAKFNKVGFYLWAIAFLLTIGQTIDYIFIHGQGHWPIIAAMGVAALIFCFIQFHVGHKIGQKYGDTVGGGQLLGQKNSTMGIWMANTFLHPLSSIFLAFYSIMQNIYNSWQIWQYNNKK